MMLRMLLLAMIWGSSFLFMRIAVPTFGTGFTAAGRIALAAFALVALARIAGLAIGWRARWKDYDWTGALSAGVQFGFFAFAAHHLPAGYSAVLNATVPLFAVLLAWKLQHARPSTSKLAGVVAGMLGVITLARFGTVSASAPTIAAFGGGLAAAALYAVGAVEVRRRFADFDPVAVAAGNQAGAALLLAPLLLLVPTQAPALAPLLALLALGLLCTGVAFALYFRLLREAGTERSSTVTFLVPLFAQLWGVLFLGESITWASVAGLSLVLLAVALVFERVRLPRRKVAAPVATPCPTVSDC
jgi:drug/metabolite transporter (DMT)-like permease